MSKPSEKINRLSLEWLRLATELRVLGDKADVLEEQTEPLGLASSLCSKLKRYANYATSISEELRKIDDSN